MTLLAFVHVNNLLCVDRQAPVRVHNHAEQPGVGLKNKGNNFQIYFNFEIKMYRRILVDFIKYFPGVNIT